MGGNRGMGMGVGVAEPADELVLAPLLPFFLLVFRPFPPFFFGGMVVNMFYPYLFRLSGLLPGSGHDIMDIGGWRLID